MEKVNEVIKENNKVDSNFFSYVFNFDEENKAGMLNMIQYTLLAILPVVILLKLVKHYIPEDDDSKPSLEVLVEIIVQLLLIFLTIWFVDKMIRFVPTYSGISYFKFNETNFIIPILIVLITMQTKLGAKINLLLDRVTELWSGKTNKAHTPQFKVTQPIVGNQHMPSQADTLNLGPQFNQNISPGNTTLISDLPMNTQQQQPQQQQQQIQVQNDVLDPSPLMAANEALGGIFGSSF